MSINSVIELAKIEGGLETLVQLRRLGLKNAAEIEKQFDTLTSDFYSIYSKGDIDTALSYEIALNISNLISDIDVEAWSLYHLFSENTGLASKDEIIDSAVRLKAEHQQKILDSELRKERRENDFHVKVTGTSGGDNVLYEKEIGSGGKSFEDALSILKQFEREYETSKSRTNGIEDKYDFEPFSAIIVDKVDEIVCNALWEKGEKKLSFNLNTSESDVKQAHETLALLNLRYSLEARADNRHSCILLEYDITKQRNQLIGKKWQDNAEIKNSICSVFNNKEENKQTANPSTFFRNEIRHLSTYDNDKKNVTQPDLSSCAPAALQKKIEVSEQKMRVKLA